LVVLVRAFGDADSRFANNCFCLTACPNSLLAMPLGKNRIAQELLEPEDTKVFLSNFFVSFVSSW
jgi:hypothetical protein